MKKSMYTIKAGKHHFPDGSKVDAQSPAFELSDDITAKFPHRFQLVADVVKEEEKEKGVKSPSPPPAPLSPPSK